MGNCTNGKNSKNQKEIYLATPPGMKESESTRESIPQFSEKYLIDRGMVKSIDPDTIFKE